MIRIAICDNEAAEAERIEGYVRDAYDFDISVYTKSEELARSIADGAAFDMYLLDVVMPPPDGIALARMIREKDEAATIIYLTSFEEHSMEAYRVQASQYLIKPVSPETLGREIDRALVTMKAKKSNTFLLKTKDGATAIPFYKIVCCELKNRALALQTADGRTHVSVSLHSSFEEAVAPLLADERFISPHVSFIVNMDYVTGLQGSNLVMKTGGTAPIARRLLAEIKEKYTRHFL